MKPLCIVLIAALSAPSSSVAQGVGSHSEMDHTVSGHAAMMTNPMNAQPAPSEGGQAAFAAIQEIVQTLMADPETDWTRVDVTALRQHLRDMDNVTMAAEVQSETIEGGVIFVVTSPDEQVAASIRRMAFAHAATMNGTQGWDFSVQDVENGVAFSAAGDTSRIRALGFVGLMTVGAHHQQHHLALARGEMPH